MLLKYLRIFLENFILIHTWASQPGSQEYGDIGILESLALIIHAIKLDILDSHVARIF